jgi:parvulin-like peptidyl-prolyl isomerase
MGPAQIPIGFVIAKVLEKKPARTLSLDEARDHVTREVKQKKLSQRRAEFFSELRSRAEIEILLP